LPGCIRTIVAGEWKLKKEFCDPGCFQQRRAFIDLLLSELTEHEANHLDEGSDGMLPEV
jgi:hypothetical protein